MRILIFGAAGFIGSHLVRFAADQGHDAVAFCRSGAVKSFSGEAYAWSLGESVPSEEVGAAGCAIHLAHDFSGLHGAGITYSETLACVARLRAQGVPRQIFFSSYSAGIHAKSLYGQTKFAIEHGLKGEKDVAIVRPGLVIGEGGLYGRIMRWARRMPVIPLPDGGYGNVPVVSVERLCSDVLALALAGEGVFKNEVNLFDSRLKSLRQLVVDAAEGCGRRPLLVNVPSILIIMGLRLAEFFRISLPVNVDNLNGFLANQNAKHFSEWSEDEN